MTRVAVVIPTLGRDTLKSVLDKLESCVGDSDEVHVVSDVGLTGPDTVSDRDIFKARTLYGRRPRQFHFWETGPTQRWGNPQRDLGMSRATTDWIAFADDDDLPADDLFEILRVGCARSSSLIQVFRMQDRDGRILGGQIIGGQIGTPQFVIARSFLPMAPRWDFFQGGDSDAQFIARCVAAYGNPPVYHDEIVSYVRKAT